MEKKTNSAIEMLNIVTAIMNYKFKKNCVQFYQISKGLVSEAPSGR